jgi:hypothetical protein
MVALVTLVASSISAGSALAGSTIDPGMYDELASGVGRVVVRDCAGGLRSQGTGFLVGTKVVMTAHHVLDDRRACDVRVQIGGRTYVGERWTSWYKGSRRTTDDVDVSTIKLTTHADGHVFEFARVHPRPRDTVAMIGHSAANPLSLSQGKFLSTKTIKGIPTLAVFLQAARGASGSPLINDRGTVVGVLQKGVADIDGGVVLGIDLVRERGLPRALCRAYPSGGIAGCGTSPAKPATGSKPKPAPKPTPAPAPVCLDKRYLADVGPDWQAATTAWTAWTTLPAGSADPLGVLERALDAIDGAVVESSMFVATDVCSAGLRRAIGLVEGLGPLSGEAREKLETYLATPRGTPAWDTALDQAGKALAAVGTQVEAIDAAFASR